MEEKEGEREVQIGGEGEKGTNARTAPAAKVAEFGEGE